MITDEQLLKKIKADDQEAFSILVYRYHTRLYQLIYNRVRSEDDAKDILQEILISFWYNRHGIIGTNLFAYLSRSVFYAVINWQITHKKSIMRHQLLLESDEPALHAIESQVIANELHAELLQVVDRLPPTTRKVFRMSRIEQKSTREIARELSLSEQTVKNNISMALLSLKKHLLTAARFFLI